jgi:hypothetical protein
MSIPECLFDGLSLPLVMVGFLLFGIIGYSAAGEWAECRLSDYPGSTSLPGAN